MDRISGQCGGGVGQTGQALGDAMSAGVEHQAVAGGCAEPARTTAPAPRPGANWDTLAPLRMVWTLSAGTPRAMRLARNPSLTTTT